MTRSSLFVSFAVTSLCATAASAAQAQPAPAHDPRSASPVSGPAEAPPEYAPTEDPAAVTAAPTVQPAPPPATPPPAPVQAAAPATGEWVHTAQYGWIWMPYGNQYVSTPEATAVNVYPSAYVYAPALGWTWLSAPWIWGWGPEVYVGIGGAGHFGWYHPRGTVWHGGALAGGVRLGGAGGGHFGGHFGAGHFGAGGHGRGGHR